MLPGAAVRSIAAEDYRLARDRGASFGRGKEEAYVPKASRRRFGERLTGEYGVVLPGDRLTSPKAARLTPGPRGSVPTAKGWRAALLPTRDECYLVAKPLEENLDVDIARRRNPCR